MIARRRLTWAMALSFVACNPPPVEIGQRVRTTANLKAFDSCGELEVSLKEHFKEEMRARLLSAYGGWGSRENLAGDAVFAEGGANAPEGRQEGVDYSGTNNQESGVDEADFVKTDGYFIYLLNGNRLEILAVPEFGELESAGTATLEGWPINMLLAPNKVVVFSTIDAYQLPKGHPLRQQVGQQLDLGWWAPIANLVKITVFDVTDRASPAVSRELYLQGHYQTARRVDDTVRVASYATMDVPNVLHWPELPETFWGSNTSDAQREAAFNQAVLATIQHNDQVIDASTLSDYLPQIVERVGASSFVHHGFTGANCRNFSIAEDGISRGVTSLLSLGLGEGAFTFEHDHLITNWSVLYASTDTLLVAETAQDTWWFWDNDDFTEATNIHRFDISVPGKTRYTGSGRIDGLIRDQFSLSEHEGTIRVASTTGQWMRWWAQNPAEPESHVYCLGGEDTLRVLGHVGGIAPGEQIWSSRFVGDEGFLVTFRTIDPLWTIDLSDPTAPTIKGELEVPGVSTYIHPLGDRLLTIGFGGTEAGLDWTTQVSLFDVSDFENPTLADAMSLAPPSDNGWSYAYSEATWEHKAFQYWNGLLAIPLSTYRWSSGGEHYEYYSRLKLLSVNEGGLASYGEIDHSPYYNSSADVWWSNRDVRRSIFMGDYIYAISDRAVTAHVLDGLAQSAAVELPGSTGPLYWWW